MLANSLEQLLQKWWWLQVVLTEIPVSKDTIFSPNFPKVEIDSPTFVGDSVKKRVINKEAVSLWPALRFPSHHQLTRGWSLQT